MFYIKGQLQGCFTTAPTEQRPETSYKLQIMGETLTKDEQVIFDIVNINVPYSVFTAYENLRGQEVSLPVGLMVSGGTGKLQPYFPKGYTKDVLQEATRA